MPRPRRRAVPNIALSVMAAVMAAACGGQASGAERVTLRLGYLSNVTQATALVGIGHDFLAGSLGEEAALEAVAFHAGGEVIEALFAGAIDAAYLGPNPAINGFAQSDGDALRIVAGATSGGASLVVRPGITSVGQLAGSTLATPALGNTQDVALRTWLAGHGLVTDEWGGGDVSIVPQDNAATLDAFVARQIDGASVPEPWATRLSHAGGTVLVDEAGLWPGGRYVTTHLVVSRRFLADHSDTVRDLLRGHVAATDYVNEHPVEAQRLVNDQIERVTRQRIGDAVLAASWPHLTFTVDPIASSLRTQADHAVAAGLLDDVDLTGIYDLTLLDDVLVDAGRDPVQGP
jgi:NitT/TauT family transport system substrate-binding protein